MTDYIQGPNIGKTEYIREAGGILLEQRPSGLAPTGAYVCVVSNMTFEAAAVVDNERDLRDFSDPDDHRPKAWLHVGKDVLDKLLFAGG
jgi:hypothetical protein